MIGRTLSHFEITAKLGQGGMGEVYRAEDTRLGREVAIKVLPRNVANEPDRLARFEREARAVAALSHPNILAIHEFGSDDGVAYAVMELLEARPCAPSRFAAARSPAERQYRERPRSPVAWPRATIRESFTGT